MALWLPSVPGINARRLRTTMVKNARKDNDATMERSRSLVAQAKAVVEAAIALCERARTSRTAAAAARRLSPKHTAELIKALDTASDDLERLKGDIDSATQDELRPQLKRR